MSRESAELDSIARAEARAMQREMRRCEKNQARDLRGRARRCGAVFQEKSTTIAHCLTRTDLARELFDRGNSVLDRGACAEQSVERGGSAEARQLLTVRHEPLDVGR